MCASLYVLVGYLISVYFLNFVNFSPSYLILGSEANELALRIARTYTKQKDIIVIDGAYHGNTASLIDARYIKKF